jgi:hypothetical protein
MPTIDVVEVRPNGAAHEPADAQTTAQTPDMLVEDIAARSVSVDVHNLHAIAEVKDGRYTLLLAPENDEAAAAETPAETPNKSPRKPRKHRVRRPSVVRDPALIALYKTWPTKDEVVKILGLRDERRLNEKIRKEEFVIEIHLIPRKGLRHEPRCNPNDVEAIRARLEAEGNLPFVLAADSGIGPRMDEGSNGVAKRLGAGDLMAFFGALMDRQTAALERIVKPPVAVAVAVYRGPWLDVEAAAARSGLSTKVLLRIIRRKLAAGDLADCGKDLRVFRIRQAALDEITGADLKPARRAARPNPAAQTLAVAL